MILNENYGLSKNRIHIIYNVSYNNRNDMKNPLEALGYEIVGELSVFKIFDKAKAKVKEDKEAIKKAYELGIKLSQSIKS